MIEKSTNTQKRLFDLDSSCGKMLPGHSVPTKGKTSEQSLKKPQGSSTQMSQFLDLRTGNGKNQDTYWQTGTVLRGAHMMANTGESPSSTQVAIWSKQVHPNVVVESRLSQILEANPPQKYCLSPAACRGILNRARKRGKVLPPILQEALERQAAQASNLNLSENSGDDLEEDISEEDDFYGDEEDFEDEDEDPDGQEPISFEPGAASRVGGHVYEDGTTGTLRAEMGDNQSAVVCLEGNGQRSSHKGAGSPGYSRKSESPA